MDFNMAKIAFDAGLTQAQYAELLVKELAVMALVNAGATKVNLEHQSTVFYKSDKPRKISVRISEHD